MARTKAIFINGIEHKKCNVCEEVLTLDSFDKAGKLKDGSTTYRSRCKKCQSKYSKKHYKKNTDKFKEYYEENREKKIQKVREYYQNNKEAKRAYNQHYYNENKQVLLVKMKNYRDVYYANNPDKNKERWSKYYSKNKDKVDSKNKQYIRLNIEKIRQYTRRYYLENREVVLEKNKSHYRANVDKYMAKVHKRRALKLSNGGSYTKEEWERCIDFFNGCCAYSGVKINKENTHIEHIIPLTKGGSNNIYNIVPSLNRVNLSKGNRDMEEWYREQPYFSEERLIKIYNWIGINKKNNQGVIKK